MRTGEPDGLRRPPVEAIERRNHSLIIRLAGEIDLYNAEEVGAALHQAATDAPERLVIDLAEVTFVDSTALGILVEAKKEVPPATLFILATPGTDVRRALEVSGLAQHFDVRDSVDEALTAQG